MFQLLEIEQVVRLKNGWELKRKALNDELIIQFEGLEDVSEASKII